MDRPARVVTRKRDPDLVGPVELAARDPGAADAGPCNTSDQPGLGIALGPGWLPPFEWQLRRERDRGWRGDGLQVSQRPRRTTSR